MLLMSTLAGVPYKTYAIEGAFDAIVIGSGIGGLAAAALLARHAGKRVLVLERHYVAGGFTHVFHRPGWEWDVGVHYVGQAGQGGGPRSQVRAMFDEISEGRLQWNAMPDVYDRIQIADRCYDFVTGAERFRERMQEYFPGERRAIARYVEQVRAAAGANALYFAEKDLPAALASVAGPLLRWRFLRYAG